MNNPILVVTIDNQPIPTLDISEFKLETNIYNNLPEGSFILRDQGGRYLSLFQFAIGSSITIMVMDGEDSKNNDIAIQGVKSDDTCYLFTPFVISVIKEATTNIASPSLDSNIYIEFICYSSN